MDLVDQAAFNHDGKLIISLGFDYKLKIQDILTGECVKSIEDNGDQFDAAVFNHDGSLLVTACMKIRIWDLSSDECIKTLLGHAS